MRIIFSGGGTIGSVSPLIAIYQELKQQQPDAEVLWLSTKTGPEDKIINYYKIPTQTISSGKLRRYFSLQNFVDPFRILAGFFQSLSIIKKFRPNVVVSAGGYVAVPVSRASNKLKIPVLIHQSDIEIGMANKIMRKYANIITVGFKESLQYFGKSKTVVTGIPVRSDMQGGLREAGLAKLKLKDDLPTLLIIGGGTGAKHINQFILEVLPQLVEFCQVIHLTGGKIDQKAEHPRYRAIDFALAGLRDIYAAADLVVSRAGMAALAELTVLGKPVILIPIPNSAQIKNASVYFNANAALLIQQENLEAESFVSAIKELLKNDSQRKSLSMKIKNMMPPDAAQRIVKMIV